MFEIIRVYVLLREETPGLPALHDTLVRAHPRGGDREGEAKREGEGAREDERGRERFTRHHLIRSVYPLLNYSKLFDLGCMLSPVR